MNEVNGNFSLIFFRLLMFWRVFTWMNRMDRIVIWVAGVLESFEQKGTKETKVFSFSHFSVSLISLISAFSLHRLGIGGLGSGCSFLVGRSVPGGGSGLVCALVRLLLCGCRFGWCVGFCVLVALVSAVDLHRGAASRWLGCDGIRGRLDAFLFRLVVSISVVYVERRRHRGCDRDD